MMCGLKMERLGVYLVIRDLFYFGLLLSRLGFMMLQIISHIRLVRREMIRFILQSRILKGLRRVLKNYLGILFNILYYKNVTFTLLIYIILFKYI
jgi:hypothetical protein